MTLVVGRPVVRTRKRPFEARGKRSRDADAWANKGVLQTVVDVQFGELEIYCTHLFAGGSLLKLDVLSDTEKLEVKLSQVNEIVKFYKDTHKAGNVAILVGDFNLAPINLGLDGQLATIGLRDVWKQRNRSPGGTSQLDALGRVLCPLDLQDPSYCDDFQPQAVSSRIDRIFVEAPKPEHRFTLDLTRPRRVPFERAIETDNIRFMSDHLGLETTLIISPSTG